MPFVPVTYGIKSGNDDEVAEVFGDFQRPKSTAVPACDTGTAEVSPARSTRATPLHHAAFRAANSVAGWRR